MSVIPPDSLAILQKIAESVPSEPLPPKRELNVSPQPIHWTPANSSTKRKKQIDVKYMLNSVSFGNQKHMRNHSLTAPQHSLGEKVRSCIMCSTIQIDETFLDKCTAREGGFFCVKKRQYFKSLAWCLLPGVQPSWGHPSPDFHSFSSPLYPILHHLLTSLLEVHALRAA
ncbi:MAG: hypothetical protein H7836_07540 [Magnetococcus sp. YQC-3]